MLCSAILIASDALIMEESQNNLGEFMEVSDEELFVAPQLLKECKQKNIRNSDFVKSLQSVTDGDILIVSQLCEVSAKQSLPGSK